MLPDNRMTDKFWPLSLSTTRGRNKGSEWATGPMRSDDAHTHTYTVIPWGLDVLPTTYCQILRFDRLAEGLWNLRWAESRHFRGWCGLELLLRFTVALKLLSPPAAIQHLCFNANGEPLWWKPFVWKCVCLLWVMLWGQMHMLYSCLPPSVGSPLPSLHERLKNGRLLFQADLILLLLHRNATDANANIRTKKLSSIRVVKRDIDMNYSGCPCQLWCSNEDFRERQPWDIRREEKILDLVNLFQ